MEKQRINITYLVLHNEGGVFFYRCIQPMTMLKMTFGDKYDIFITNDIDEAWKNICNTDILVVHGCLYENKMQMKAWNLVVEARKIGVKTVLDIDDYWNYGQDHPLIGMCMTNMYPIKSTINFNLFDHVTTTTGHLRNEIIPYNSNVHILENGICTLDDQFSKEKNPSGKVRVGITGGSSHVKDMEVLVDGERCFTDLMDKDARERMQMVLCGFNMNGAHISIDEEGNVIGSSSIDKDDMWWIRIEKQLTHCYADVSDEYRELLLRYDGSDQEFDSSNEPYRRVWAKSITDGEYGMVYKDIDVLLAPLKDTKFNQMKSELKQIEAGFTGTAVIASDIVPYSAYGTDRVDTMLVGWDMQSWADAISEVVNDSLLRGMLAENLGNKASRDRDMKHIVLKYDKLYSKIAKKSTRVKH